MSAADAQDAVDAALVVPWDEGYRQAVAQALPHHSLLVQLGLLRHGRQLVLPAFVTRHRSARQLAANHKDLAEAWRQWLEDNSGSDSWNIQKVREKQTELEDEAWGRDNAGVEQDSDEVTLLLADLRGVTTSRKRTTGRSKTSTRPLTPKIVEHIKRPDATDRGRLRCFLGHGSSYAKHSQ